MEIIESVFDKSNEEYSLTIKSKNKIINVWLTLINYNQLSEDELFIICSCVEDETINISFLEVGDLFIRLNSKNIHILFHYNDEENPSLSIDQINVLNESEYIRRIKINKAEKLLKVVSLN